MEMTAGTDDDGRRLDRLLRKALPELPLSAIHRLLRTRRVLVDGVPAGGDLRVRTGSTISVPGDFREPAVQAGPGGGMPDIVWEGAGLLVLNKPRGIAAHGPGSLETQARAYLRDRLPRSLSFKPGPLHRLDKPTSGVIIFSASLAGARRVSALIRTGGIKKRYLALVDGILDSPAVWEDPLVRDHTRRKTLRAAGYGGKAKNARTRVFPLAVSSAHSLIMAETDTGRTHQIRAQAAARGHPLSGDIKYGGTFLEGGFLLHALSLEFSGEGLPRTLEAPPPGAFLRRIREFFGDTAVKGLTGRPGLPCHSYVPPLAAVQTTRR
jgi:23S rRNA pseudouridine955/2504/2580 synthase